jgi:dTDP-4-dehydrorhamnose reductase
MKVAVIGANGQLGNDLTRTMIGAGYDLIGLTHEDVEISELDAVQRVLRLLRPSVVVNTAAMHNVEKCEADPEKAYRVNAIGVRNLAMITQEIGCVFVHISTDYVFDGEKLNPYVEGDEPLPLNVYGNSKLAGECYVRTLNPRHFVIRTSALYGVSPCRAKGGLNFVDLMLKLARERGHVRVVDSERVSPTPTADLAAQIVQLVKAGAYGLYHGTAEGSCSWYEFAREILSAARMKAKVEIASSSELPAKVPRPRCSVLENLALKQAGLNCFRDWQLGLRQYLEETQAVAVS